MKHPHCCPNAGFERPAGGVTRRTFLGMSGLTLGATAMGGLSWSHLAAAGAETAGGAPGRRPLTVAPVLVYSIPRREFQTSWRSWGGIQTEADAAAEVERIGRELQGLKKAADFPVEFLPLTRVKSAADVAAAGDLARADVLLVYAAGGWMDAFEALGKAGKDMIFFCRHKSGPVYLWYEIISPRYLHQHTDALALANVSEMDVVVDSQPEILWRLRALAGLRNTMGMRIVAIGGPDAWAQPAGVVPNLVRDIWKLDMRTLSYDELGGLIKAARADAAAVAEAKRGAADYLSGPGVKLETGRGFVENAFLLASVFRGIMAAADCRAITVSGCMGTIMPLAETSACLTLSLLNDAGYQAFCESDFVVIPSGMLMANITGRPVFLNDPTFPHDGIITLAHCTAPRKMDGKALEPVRILTHFESDYGAAPKVEMAKGRKVTSIIPDFASKRWVGLPGEVVDAPFLDICRSQIDVSFPGTSRRLAENMPGFHWMTGYGDSLKETGYALKRVGIRWEVL